MKRSLPPLLAALALLATTVPARADLEIGSLDASRTDGGWTLNGSAMADSRLKLENLDNFGPDGMVFTTLDITDVSATLSNSVLAPFDVFFYGYVDDGELTNGEKNAVRNWVLDGGVLLLTCDGTDHDDTCQFFGRNLGGGATNTTVPAAGQLGNPPFTGPFGTAAIIEHAGDYSYFASSAGATVLGVDGSGRPTILAEELGEGVVVYLGDVDMISDYTVSTGATIDPTDDNDVFLGNLFAFLAAETCPDDALCLRDGRFRVTVTWENRFGATGIGHPVPLTDDSGSFWFFDDQNLEMILKVLDGCPVNSRYWVFAGGLTNVEVRMEVTDTDEDVTKIYTNPQRTAFAPIQDTSAFATCP